MNLVQHPDFPDVKVGPMEGPFSYRNHWQEVMEAFAAAGFEVREPNERRRQASPCYDFAWYFVVSGLDRHHEVLVTDQPMTPDREEMILRGAFGMIEERPGMAFHVYSADKLSARMRTALADSPAGRFLRRVAVEIPISDIRPMGVPHVVPRILRMMEQCWQHKIDLDAPGDVLQWLDDVIIEYRPTTDPDEQLPTPGDVLTPPLAAIGLVVTELLRQHLPGPARIHASVARAEHDRLDDDRLEAQDWAFVLAVAGGAELEYVYGPGKVFTRYCQGAEQTLLDLLPTELAFPLGPEAMALVENLPDDPTVEED